MAFKIARIVDLCGKSSGLADFENTVDRGSAVIFDADSGLLSPKRNLDHRSFFSVGWYLNDELVQIMCFFERSSLNSGVRLLLELYCVVLGKINNGIHMYGFNFEPLQFCFRKWLWFRI